MATDQSSSNTYGGRSVTDQDILELTGKGNESAYPKAPHTIMIIVGALVILWILGAVTFKGIRQ